MGTQRRAGHSPRIDQQLGTVRNWVPYPSPMNRCIEIAVVGGGPSAVCLLDALAQAESAPGVITVFEPSPHLWRGRAFQPDLDSVRVNIAPDGMSVRFGDSGHFERWLVARDLLSGARTDWVDPFCGVRFVPRARFGEYLEQSGHAALARLRALGWRTEVIRDCVESAAPAVTGITLRTERGRQITADYTVLCVGRGHPSDVYKLAGTPGFVPEPYPLAHSLAGIDPDHAIGVVGSGLTGVDVVLGLAARGHCGKILLLSRSGALPVVRQRPVPYTLRYFTPERFRGSAITGQVVTLDQLVAAMRAELAVAKEDLGTIAAEIASLSHEDPVRRLRRHLAGVDSPSLALRIVQRAVPIAGPDVWPPLPEHEKAELLRKHYRAVMSVCCPMPPAAAATLLSLIDFGRLDIVSGVRHIGASPGGGFEVLTGGDEYRVDVVINAVNGPTDRIPAKAEPLITSLVSAGVADRNPHGGVHIDRATSRVLADGAPDPRLYALGDLASGSLFFTFGLPSLVDRAHDIVAALSDGAAVAGLLTAGQRSA